MDASALARRPIEQARAVAASPRAPAAVSAVLVAVLGWQLAGLTWTALPQAAPAAPPDESAVAPQDVQADSGEASPATRVARLHLFGAPPARNDFAAAPETKLNLSLKGIYAAGNGAGIAIIAAGGAPEEVYSVGDRIAGNALITAIFPDRVILRRGGQAETLRMNTEAASRDAGASAGSGRESAANGTAPSQAARGGWHGAGGTWA